MPPKRKGGPTSFEPGEICKGIKVEMALVQTEAKHRVWNNLDTPCDKTNVELFNASTVVEVGNGKSTFFWTSGWISGKAEKKYSAKIVCKVQKKKDQTGQGVE